MKSIRTDKKMHHPHYITISRNLCKHTTTKFTKSAIFLQHNKHTIPLMWTCLAKRALAKHLKKFELSWICLLMAFLSHLFQFILMCFIAVIMVLVVLLILV
jgi:hypothetical protein